jgi:integrase
MSENITNQNAGENKPVNLSRQPIVTHGQLITFVADHQRQSGMSSGAINNYKSSYKRFLRVLGLMEDSTIGDELNGDFDTSLDEFEKAIKGKKKSTRESYKSHVREVQKLYAANAIKPLPDSFHGALVALLLTAGYTIYGFWKEKLKNSLSKDTFQRWCNGKSAPSIKKISIVEQLELIFGVEEGTLVNRLSKRIWGIGSRPAGLTTFGKKMQQALKNRYTVWTSRLENQFERICAHMSSPIRLEGTKRNSVWTSSPGTVLPSAKLVKNFCRSFFGFCCLPKADPDPYRNVVVAESERSIAYMSGLNMSPKNMSFALFAIKELNELYLEFQRVRAGGIYTSGTLTYISIVTALLHHETGYLYQHPEFAEDLTGMVDDPEMDWQERCITTRQRLLDIRHDLLETKQIEFGREPMEPIQAILDHPRPLQIIFLMLEAIKKDMPPPAASPLRRAEHFRNFLLLNLLAANPLRIRMYAMMEIGKHIMKDSDGSWWLTFSGLDFKNRNKGKKGRGKKSSKISNRNNDYKVRIAPEVGPYLEEYLKDHRPHLVGASECDYLFLPSVRVGSIRTAKGMTPEMLSHIVNKMTYFYVPLDDNSGFGPHAFRHIVATDIIKKDPSIGFFLAAIALHDELETVKENYIHLQTSEFFEPVNRHFSQTMRETYAAMGTKQAASAGV